MKILIKKLASTFSKNPIAILLFRKLYRYSLKRKFKINQENFLKNGTNLLLHLKRIFDQNNIIFWLDFGTLLGAYRDGNFIKHDFDIDLGVFYKDKNVIQNLLISNGFKLVKEFWFEQGDRYGIERTYSYLGVNVDLFFFHLKENKIVCHGFASIPKSYTHKQIREKWFPFNGFASIKFLNQLFRIPKNVEEHLKLCYGENFMIPNPNYNLNDITDNLTIIPIETMIGYFKEFN